METQLSVNQSDHNILVVLKQYSFLPYSNTHDKYREEFIKIITQSLSIAWQILSDKQVFPQIK